MGGGTEVQVLEAREVVDRFYKGGWVGGEGGGKRRHGAGGVAREEEVERDGVGAGGEVCPWGEFVEEDAEVRRDVGLRGGHLDGEAAWMFGTFGSLSGPWSVWSWRR